MKTQIWIATIIFVTCSLFADERDLPPESTELLKKLAAWELEQQAELQSRIKEKRKDVIEVLKAQSTKAKQIKNEKGSIAIDEAIVQLEDLKIAQRPGDKEAIEMNSRERRMKEFEESLHGSTWKLKRETGGERTIRFSGKNLTLNDGKGDRSYQFEIISASSLQFSFIKDGKPAGEPQIVNFSRQNRILEWNGYTGEREN